MRHNLAWSIASEPDDDHERAVDLLARLRATNPPTLAEDAIIAVVRQHLCAGDDPAGEQLLGEILDEEEKND